MEIFTLLAIFVLALIALVKGSDWFIGSAEHMGQSFGIPSFIIGVTIVAFGTSLPELATSIVSVYAGESAIVAGNVIGSNITNILLVLGLVAVATKQVELNRNIMDIDIPLLVISSFFIYFVMADGAVQIVEAILLLFALAIFLIHSLTGEKEAEEGRVKFKPTSILLLILGGVFVYLGATYTIDSLIKLSALMGIESELIALSLVALGTSLPEVVVSITAARKGQTGIAIGNILGSNIFNTYAVMSIPRFFGELEIPENIIGFYLPFMIAVTLIFAFLCISKKIQRWEGLMLLILYIYFLVSVIQENL